MAFVHGHGITSDILSKLVPASPREAALLTALDTAYRTLEKIQYRDGSLDMDAYDGLKAVERIVVACVLETF